MKWNANNDVCLGWTFSSPRATENFTLLLVFGRTYRRLGSVLPFACVFKCVKVDAIIVVNVKNRLQAIAKSSETHTHTQCLVHSENKNPIHLSFSLSWAFALCVSIPSKRKRIRSEILFSRLISIDYFNNYNGNLHHTHTELTKWDPVSVQ